MGNWIFADIVVQSIREKGAVLEIFNMHKDLFQINLGLIEMGLPGSFQNSLLKMHTKFVFYKIIVTFSYCDLVFFSLRHFVIHSECVHWFYFVLFQKAITLIELACISLRNNRFKIFNSGHRCCIFSRWRGKPLLRCSHPLCKTSFSRGASSRITFPLNLANDVRNRDTICGAPAIKRAVWSSIHPSDKHIMPRCPPQASKQATPKKLTNQQQLLKRSPGRRSGWHFSDWGTGTDGNCNFSEPSAFARHLLRSFLSFLTHHCWVLLRGRWKNMKRQHTNHDESHNN